MKIYTALAILMLSAVPASAQNYPPEILDLLKSIKAAGDKAGALLEPPTPTPTPPPAESTVVSVPVGADLQKAVNTAKPSQRVEMEPGGTYGAVIITTPGITLTTRGWVKGERLAVPADAPAMATVQGNGSAGVKVAADDVTLNGFQVLWNTPSGQGELVRIGEATDPDLSHVPVGTKVTQLLLRGNAGTVFGQKRGIMVSGRNTLVQWNWCDRIWIAGQDSQCVASWSSPGGLKILNNALSSASENILIGGTPPASEPQLPDGIEVAWNAIWKDPAWKIGNHQVKNLLEVKFGRHVWIHDNWLEGSWVAAQNGTGVLLTLAINGQCTYCELFDVVFERNVVWNVGSGLQILGHNYTLAYGPAGQAHGIVVRNNLWFIDGPANLYGDGRGVSIGSEPKDVALLNNTWIYTGNSVVNGYYGKKFPVGATAPVDGGPVLGFRFEDNLSRHSNYGIFTPNGSSGAGLSTFFPGGIFAGNVLAGAIATSAAKYDAASGGRLNLYPTVTDFNAAFRDRAGLDLCLKDGVFAGKGADCATLPFKLRALVPVP